MGSLSRQIALEQLAGRAQAGCSASFGELARRVSPGLLAFLRRRSPTWHDAEDLRQETLLSAYENLATYDPSRPFEPWLRSIAVRLVALRARKHRSPGPLQQDVVDDGPHADVAAAQRDAEDRLWETAAKVLPLAQYRALRLRHAEQLDIRDTAARMGISQANVKVLLFRARQRLMALSKVRALLDAPPLEEEDCHGV